jgi:hypothetical protein
MSTSSLQLRNLAKKYNIKLDYIIYKDQLVDIPIKDELNIIINMSNSDEAGTHWVCLYINKPRNLAIYADSFGIVPPLTVTDYINTHNLTNYYYSNIVIQDSNHGHCGQYSLNTLRLCQQYFG